MSEIVREDIIDVLRAYEDAMSVELLISASRAAVPYRGSRYSRKAATEAFERVASGLARREHGTWTEPHTAAEGGNSLTRRAGRPVRISLGHKAQ